MLKHLKLALVCGVMAFSATQASAEDVINAVHFTPAQNNFAKSFLKFVDMVNERGKGVVKINVRGGPEVVPMSQQGTAQQSGLIDMINTPAGPYLEIVPEGEVFSASTKTPMEIRENGGWDVINKIYEEKGNAHLIAHIDAGEGFNIFTVEEPTPTPDGGIDWSKLKLRASALYRQFFESLGATVIVMAPGDIYTALERGVIDSTAYPIFGYKSFGWDKFTKYRVEPSFFQIDVLVSMNKDKWDSLSEESKKIINDVAIEYEKESMAEMQAKTKAEAELMESEGQQVVTLTGKGKEEFLAKAAKASWDRMTARDPSHIEELRKYFQ